MNCKQCNEPLEFRSPCEVGTKKYCSTECVHLSQRKQSNFICKYCRIEYQRPQCFQGRSQYCSRKCKDNARHKVADLDKRGCYSCNNIYLITDFPKNGGGKHGYLCKECSKTRASKSHRTLKGRLVFARSLAKRRKIDWVLSSEEYFQLLTNPCHYCGLTLDPTGVGLDRKDYKQGYQLDNVVPSCGLCNVTKMANFSYEEMLILGKTIRQIVDARLIEP